MHYSLAMSLHSVLALRRSKRLAVATDEEVKQAFLNVTFGHIGALHGWSNSMADPQAACESSNLGLYLVDEPGGDLPKPPGRAGALALSALAGFIRLSGESLGGEPAAERFLRRATPKLWEAIDSNETGAVEKVTAWDARANFLFYLYK